MKKLQLIIILTIFSCYLKTCNLWAQSISSHEIDSIVLNTIKAFKVPGIAVSVIKDGKILHNKGYGLCFETGNKRVDENTLFAIASNSKAFTTAALGILVDEKKLSFNDKVTKFIPEFKMYDRFVTEEFTIYDLITHRSGLGLGAGDLMIFPSNKSFTKEDIIYNLRYLKPTTSFRSKYDYDNLLYIVAGEVIERVSGISWEEFVEQKIFKPLEMKASAASYERLKDTTNIAVPHIPIDGKLKVIGRFNSNITNAAGGIYTNTKELSHWMMALLNSGTYNGRRLFSPQISKEIWTPQTLQSPAPMPYFRSNFKAYGLGWEIEDINGYRQISHTGGLPGMVSQVLMIPEIGLGIVILTNQQSGLAFMSISDNLKDYFLKNGTHDRIKMYSDFEKLSVQGANKKLEEVDKIISQSQLKNTIDIKGTYTDPWFGKVTLSEEKGNYLFESHRSPALKGKMYFYKANTFVVKWDDRSMNADAFVMFNLDENGATKTFSMKAISPTTDFSFDFQDLSFVKDK